MYLQLLYDVNDCIKNSEKSSVLRKIVETPFKKVNQIIITFKSLIRPHPIFMFFFLKLGTKQ